MEGRTRGLPGLQIENFMKIIPWHKKLRKYSFL